MDENETGLVKNIVNNKILVECEAVNMCNNCAENGHCNLSGDGKKRELWIDYAADIDVGNRIIFKIKDGGIIYASVLLYVVPIIFLLLSIFMGYKLHSFLNIESELSSIIFGFAGLILSFIFIKIYSILILDKERFKPIFIKKLEE
jgi:sigma-E factor negative regulatory protein RseC